MYLCLLALTQIRQACSLIKVKHYGYGSYIIMSQFATIYVFCEVI